MVFHFINHKLDINTSIFTVSGHIQATSTPTCVPAKPLSLFNPIEIAAGKPSFNFFNQTSHNNSFFNPLQQVENNKNNYQLPGAESPSSVRLFNPGQLDGKSPVTLFNPSSFGGDSTPTTHFTPSTGIRSGPEHFFEEQSDKLPPPPEIQEQVDFGENLPLPLPPTDKQVADLDVKPDIASFFGGSASTEPTKSAFAAYFTPSNVSFFNTTPDKVEEKFDSISKKDTAGIFLQQGRLVRLKA